MNQAQKTELDLLLALATRITGSKPSDPDQAIEELDALLLVVAEKVAKLKPNTVNE